MLLSIDDAKDLSLVATGALLNGWKMPNSRNAIVGWSLHQLDKRRPFVKVSDVLV